MNASIGKAKPALPTATSPSTIKLDCLKAEYRTVGIDDQLIQVMAQHAASGSGCYLESIRTIRKYRASPVV